MMNTEHRITNTEVVILLYSVFDIQYFLWCSGEDLNLHPIKSWDQPLKLACLPIPPPELVGILLQLTYSCKQEHFSFRKCLLSPQRFRNALRSHTRKDIAQFHFSGALFLLQLTYSCKQEHLQLLISDSGFQIRFEMSHFRIWNGNQKSEF
jgi:hypothetical protein